jgi:hypothetical protein
MPVADTRGRAAKEPEPPLGVEIACITGSVPHPPVYTELGLVISRPVQIAGRDMLSGDHDLAGLTRAGYAGGKLGGGAFLTDTRAGRIGEYPQVYLRNRRARHQSEALPHTLYVAGVQLISRYRGDGLGLR